MSLALRGETTGAPSALGLTEDLFDEELLYFLGGPVTWPGTAGSETDSASGGSATVGTVAAGSQGTESDAARAGSATGGAVAGGSQGTETDSGQSGSSTVGAKVTGGQGAETDTAQTGSTTVGARVAGSQGAETDAGASGTVATGQVASGAQAAETDTAQAGSATTGALAAGGQGAESDTAQTGSTTAGAQVAGSQAAETDAAQSGSATTGTLAAGGQGAETDAAQAGSATTGALAAGQQAAEGDTAMGGTVVQTGPPPTPPGTVTESREGGRTRGGYAVATWSPAVVAPPESSPLSARHVGSQAFSVPVIVGTQPVFETVSEASKKRLRHRILVGGKDVSFFRDVATPAPGYQLAEPLLWGPTSIEFPQIAAAYETPGTGVLRWCRKGAPVVYQRVTEAGEVVSVDYRGVVVDWDVTGANLRLEVGGHATGRAQLRNKPLPIFRDTLDLGRLAWAAIRDLGLRFEPRLGPATGIKQALFGGSDHLTYISELCAKAWERDGTQWTIMPSDAGVYRMQRKDRETVDFTVFNDDKRAIARLRSDAAEEPNRIFASGVTPKGQRVRFGVYPALKPSPAPEYPFLDERSFGIGTTDADTDTGDGVFVMVRRLWTAGYLSLEDASGSYDRDVANAVAALQDDTGISGPVGVMTAGLWPALFDLGTTGYSLRGSRIEPAAQAPRTRRYNRSAGGAVLGKNPNFDPHTLIVDRAIDFGGGFTRHQMREWSRAEVARGEDNWTGTIDIATGGVLLGEVAPGTIIGGDDIMDVRAIKPGMNAWLPLFAGGILVHVSGVEIGYDGNGIPTAKLYVDTQARDAMAVWEIIRRNRESRRDPGRRWKGNRASSEQKDSITEWDEVGGVLYGDVNLVAGWNVVPVVAGQEGNVSRLRLSVTGPGGEGDGREFACAVFGKHVTPARLRTLIGNPLVASPDATDEPDPTQVDPPVVDAEAGASDPANVTSAARPWWERKAVAAALRDMDLLYSAGTREDPCGYWPTRKPKGTAERTGVHRTDAGFSYRTRREPVLYVAVWVWGNRTLQGGRVMWNQLEAGA